MNQDMQKQIIFSLVVAALMATAFYVGMNYTPPAQITSGGSQKQEAISPTTAPAQLEQKVLGESFDVIFKENPKKSSMTDVYLKDLKTGKEQFFMAVPNILKYPQGEGKYAYSTGRFVNDNLYVIRSIEKQEELWRYDPALKGKKISNTDSFEINNDGTRIAVDTSSGEKRSIAILDGEGKQLREFEWSELLVGSGNDPYLSVLMGGFGNDNNFWVESAGPASYAAGFTRINLATYAVKKFDFGVGGDHAFNATMGTVAYSNHPGAFIEAEAADEYAGKKEMVALRVYNMTTKKELVIASAVSFRFEPEWIDSTTLEYNNPNGKGRIKKKIQ